MTLATASGATPSAASPSRTGLTISRWRRRGHRLVEAGIDDDGAGRPDDRPDEIIERLQHVVRIAADEVFGRAPRMMRVADRVDLVQVLAHAVPGLTTA